MLSLLPIINGMVDIPGKSVFYPLKQEQNIFNNILPFFRFPAVDKIKTIGSTYMAAVGLIPEFKILDDSDDGGISAIHYMAQLVEYVFGMRDKLANINENSYNR